MSTVTVPNAGVPLDQASINAALGAGSKGLRDSTLKLVQLQERLAGYTDQQLVDAFGFDLPTATLIKSALGEVAPFKSALDALQFLNQCWGV